MVFSEKTKSDVRKKAGFKCCICQDAGPAVHHIVPQKENGTDDIENAAPLCPSCHEKYGDNLQKRKFIREARDWWYERVKLMYRSNIGEDVKQILDKISKEVESIKSTQDVYGVAVTDLKGSLGILIDKMIDNSGTPQAISDTVSGVVDGITLKRSYFSKICEFCGNEYVPDGIYEYSDRCNNCR